MDRHPVPDRITAAHRRAEDARFELSSEPEVGRLLATLAAAVPDHGRILELGTGVGHGLAWIVEGLGERDDVEVVTVELDPEIHAVAQEDSWPGYVRFVLGDGAEAVAEPGAFDLIFPDAPGGKLANLSGTIAALRPGGLLLVDDMDLDRYDEPFVLDDGTSLDLRAVLADVRETLLGHPALVCVELNCASGLILAAKRRA